MLQVQGQAALVTRKQLLTEDADTRAEELVYDVISNPSQGRLVLDSGGQGASAAASSSSVGRFSQADIDESRLWYVHDGPLQPDSFYFRVSDGKFTPIYTVFNIQVRRPPPATPLLVKRPNSKFSFDVETIFFSNM